MKIKALSLRGAAGLAAASLCLAAGCGSTSSANPADAAVGPVCPVMDDLISDFTDDNGVKPLDGRQGGWYTYADKSGLGTLMPLEGGGATPDKTEGNAACSGLGALHVTAEGFVDWGAAMGVDLVARVPAAAGGAGTVKGTYDASKYRGISFWAKAAAPVKFAMVKFLDPHTEIPSVLPMAEWCAYQPTMPAINCSPYIVKFGYGYTGDAAAANLQDYPRYVDYKIDTTWRRFEVLFADAKQDRYNVGLKSPGDKLDTTKLMGLAIQINTDHATMPPTANNFSIWVDDVTFIK